MSQKRMSRLWLYVEIYESDEHLMFAGPMLGILGLLGEYCMAPLAPDFLQHFVYSSQNVH